MALWTPLIMYDQHDQWSFMIIDHRWTYEHWSYMIIDHSSSYMMIIDHGMKDCWSCMKSVDHAMKGCWSYMINIDHCHERLLIIHDQHWSVYHIVTTSVLSKHLIPPDTFPFADKLVFCRGHPFSSYTPNYMIVEHLERSCITIPSMVSERRDTAM